MTDEEQEARSLKFERGGTVMIRQLRSGNFAMYPCGGVGSPFWIGPAEAIPQAYADRPAFTPPVHVPRKPVAGIDLSKLEFDL